MFKKTLVLIMVLALCVGFLPAMAETNTFGWEVPEYIHCPLITDEDHRKLSKRSGHSSFEDLLEQGFTAEAVLNFVALLGWSPEELSAFLSQPVFSQRPEQLSVEDFVALTNLLV